MKLQSRLHQLTTISGDAWIFQGGRPERIQRFAYRSLDLFNAIATVAAIALLVGYWIAVLVTA